MPKHSKPRAGSLRYWPRKKAGKFLPRVNWKIINSEKPLLGFIGYKVGMTSCQVKDNTENSLTKGKTKTISSTIIELPPMKIFSVRFYKKNKLVSEIVSENINKELKSKIRIPKKKKQLNEVAESSDYDNISILAYSVVKNTGIKKTPDMTEIGLSGKTQEKLEWIKKNINKEIPSSEILKDTNIIDIRGLTKGKGTQGPVKRFGIKLKSHKAEKGRRKVGSIGPWHPARVTFRVPMAGQLGLFTRIQYNNKIISLGQNPEKINSENGWKNYGKIKTQYLILQGSVQGPAKRVLLLTQPIRPSKKQSKKNYEFIDIK